MTRPLAVLDIECFHGWFYVAVRDITKPLAHGFEMCEGAMPEALMAKLWAILKTYRILTFNGTGYDIPQLMYMLNGATVDQLKFASDRIIIGGLKPWLYAAEFGVTIQHPAIDHVDLMPVAPLTGSLKLYAARMHSGSIQDLPIDPKARPTTAEQDMLRVYCHNDLQSTIDLYRALKGHCALRDAMSLQYGIDLRSKSDAQIAEAVLTSELNKVRKTPVRQPGDVSQRPFRYTPPTWVSFRGEYLRALLTTIRGAEFQVSEKGSVLLPPAIASQKIAIGAGVYRLGIGGLHSSEVSTSHHASAEETLLDFDVTSYYPSIILNEGLYPRHLGTEFLTVYRGIVARRLAAKMAKQIVENESLKITINGSFGKFGSPYSVLYAPDLLIHVTLTGQLALLMLIESLELAGATVVSANTDGVTVRCRRERAAVVHAATRVWEQVTGFTLESKIYTALHSRDVNNYVAILDDGSVKTKGAYSPSQSLAKNPAMPICAHAAMAYLQFDADIETTIRGCTDVRQFLTVRQVTGGAVWRGQRVGKVVRWYYSTDSTDAMHYVVNGHLVPKSVGAIPCTVIHAGMPHDVDYAYYVRKATEMVAELGVATPWSKIPL